MFLFYNILLPLFMPIWLPLVWLKSKRRKEQPNWKERFGNFAHLEFKRKERIWFHAVSVGEVLASAPLLKELRRQFPKHDILLSVTTSSGHQAAREKLIGLFDHLAYFPIDILRWQLSAMQKVRPEYVVIMETELWLNFLYCAKVYDAKTVVVNGRISDKSFATSQKLKGYYSSLFEHVDLVAVQSEVDESRFKALGAKNVIVLGNVKFDQALDSADAKPEAWKDILGFSSDRTTIVVGSTRGEEEEQWVLAGLQSIGLEKLNVLFAPRHLERVPELVQKLTQVKFSLRSTGEKSNFVILDTYGELGSAYSIADVVIIGGGFAALGGQNLIQPLAHGKPVVHGPHMTNFRDVTTMSLRAGASVACEGPELGETLQELILDPQRMKSMGQAAARLIQDNAGATARTVNALKTIKA